MPGLVTRLSPPPLTSAVMRSNGCVITASVKSSVTLPEPPGPGVPVLLRVEIAGSVHGAGITAGPPPPPRRPRRTFWQWLRRAPRPPAIAA